MGSNNGNQPKSNSDSSNFGGSWYIDAGVPPLFQLVRQGKWRQLQTKLKSKTIANLIAERDGTGLSLLGVALGSHAPLDILKMIVSVDESQLHAVDMYGASSLHLACLNGSPPEAVEYILSQNHSLVTSRDHDRRAPLHHAVECICRAEIEFNQGIRIIDLLCEVDATMIHEQDLSGHAPLDLVHCAINNKSMKGLHAMQRLDFIFKMLRSISIEVYKLKKRLWEDKIPFENKKLIVGTVCTQSTSSLTNPSMGRSIAPKSLDLFVYDREGMN